MDELGGLEKTIELLGKKIGVSGRPKVIEEKEKATALDGSYHYRVIDVKFTTAKLNSAGTQLLGQSSQKAYKTQLAIYNKALSRLQEFTAPKAYLLTKNWNSTKQGQKFKGEHSLEQLATVDFSGLDSEFYGLAEEAIDWHRRVRSEGADWEVYPEPTRPELWPNCTNDQNFPWGKAKSEIANELQELTTIWQIGLKQREIAHSNQIFKSDDKNLNPQTMGITTEKRSKVVKAIVDINRDSNPEIVSPSKIDNNIGYWKNKPKLEFFVDFETVTDINDDFPNFPLFRFFPFLDPKRYPKRPKYVAADLPFPSFNGVSSPVHSFPQ